MVLTGTINNSEFLNLTSFYYLHNLGNRAIELHGIFSPYDDILFNYYFMLTMVIIGFLVFDELFEMLFREYIRKFKRKVKETIKEWVKN